MKKLIAILLVVPSLAFGQAIASRRYAEKTPSQYTFGSFTAVSPYNEADGYTLVPTAQLQPSNLVYGSSTFDSTSDFTALSGSSCTFSVASNVGTVACGSNQFSNLMLSSTVPSIASAFVSITINQNGTAGGGSQDNMGACLFKDGSNYICAFIDKANGGGGIWLATNGSGSNIGGAGFAAPAAPWQLALSLVGNTACQWINTGTGWQQLGCGTSSYDFTLDGNLAGWHPGFQVYSNPNSSTWKVSNFVAGGMGGVGVRDIQLVTRPDGTPYMQGSLAYFTATSASGGCAVFTYDVVSGVLTELSLLWSDTGTNTVGTGPYHLIYDPQSGIYRLWLSDFVGTSIYNVPFYYMTFAKTSVDPLTPGFHVVSGLQQIVFNDGTYGNGTYGWDLSAACNRWNYSADSCSQWLVCYAVWTPGTFGALFPACNTTPSEPSNSSVWTPVGTVPYGDFPGNQYEGARVLRTATGSGGVNYQAAFTGVINSATRSTILYNTTTGAYLGTGLNAPLPAGSSNPPHPQIFSYGNTEYFVTFNDNLFAGQSGTMGNWLVATAPKY